MDDAMWTVSVLAFLFLLAVEVIYYGFGSAIQNLNLNQLKEEAEEKGGKKSRQILQLAENPEKKAELPHYHAVPDLPEKYRRKRAAVNDKTGRKLKNDN